MAQKIRNEVRVGPQGRVVIPATLRKALALRPGDTLLARVENGRLILEKRDAILARVRSRYAKLPAEVSLVDDLIEERRAEASQEDIS